MSILMDLAELARRCGLRPSDADAILGRDGDDDVNTYQLYFAWTDECPEIDRFRKLLGIESPFERMSSPDLQGLEDRVEKALSLAPRARTR